MRLAIDRPNRLVFGVAEGCVTLPDLAAVTHQMIAGRLIGYRTLLDCSAADISVDGTEAGALARFICETEPAIRSGPFAAVAEDEVRVRDLVEREVFGTPAHAFDSVREARQWLSTYLDTDWAPARRPRPRQP